MRDMMLWEYDVIGKWRNEMKIWLIYTGIADIYEFSLGFFLEIFAISRIFQNFLIFPKLSRLLLNLSYLY